ncbi:Extracellular cystatin-like protease inhibitor [Phytophthora cinnamomi]|uniref:Extracellular cystatin-like protease inhibitor n=1 Tax=Phytophthora cinnamomi TaxID=4785 RepID=UPI00355A8B89|nr:Extracellular cystatin-like protease inhibitor [Phytophthora cinnamomi]
MVSLATLASSFFAVALLATVSATTSSAGKWSETKVTAGDSELLYATLADENAYNPAIKVFICVRVVEELGTKTSTMSKHVRQADSTSYKFVVGGCLVRKEYGGRCFESYFYPVCDNFDVVISPNVKTGDYAVKSIIVHKVKPKH